MFKNSVQNWLLSQFLLHKNHIAQTSTLLRRFIARFDSSATGNASNLGTVSILLIQK